MSWGHEGFEFNPSNQPVGGKEPSAARTRWFAPRPNGMTWTQYAFTFGWISSQVWQR